MGEGGGGCAGANAKTQIYNCKKKKTRFECDWGGVWWTAGEAFQGQAGMKRVKWTGMVAVATTSLIAKRGDARAPRAPLSLSLSTRHNTLQHGGHPPRLAGRFAGQGGHDDVR